MSGYNLQNPYAKERKILLLANEVQVCLAYMNNEKDWNTEKRTLNLIENILSSWIEGAKEKLGLDMSQKISSLKGCIYSSQQIQLIKN